MHHRSVRKSPSLYDSILASRLTRRLLSTLTRTRLNGSCLLESVFQTWGRKETPLGTRLRYFVPHRLIDLFAYLSGADKQTLQDRVFGHRPTRTTLINTAASIAKYGLTKPQRFQAPLIVVWNITQACNLSCQHCYQDARHKLPNELNQDEQIAVVDELADNHVGLLAFAGGEPLVSKEFWETARHAARRGLHLTVATNGTLLTEARVARLRELGVKIIEISLDSVDPEKHNAFRGKGAWQRTVRGIKNAVAQSDGLNYRVSIASTITRMNFDEVEDLIQFAKDIGAHTFNAFNFIPTGRGRQMARDDLTPDERQQVFRVLYRHLKERQINILSTAPQLGRYCLEMQKSDLDPMMVGHGGSGISKDITIFTEYIGGCGSGRCYCAIQPDGTVTPCVFMPLPVGDLRKQSFMEIWRTRPEFDVLSDRENRTDTCRVCKFRYQCGGCRARAYNYTGDFRAGDPGCIYNQKQWDRLTEDEERLADIAL